MNQENSHLSPGASRHESLHKQFTDRTRDEDEVAMTFLNATSPPMPTKPESEFIFLNSANAIEADQILSFTKGKVVAVDRDGFNERYLQQLERQHQVYYRSTEGMAPDAGRGSFQRLAAGLAVMLLLAAATLVRDRLQQAHTTMQNRTAHVFESLSR